MITITVSGPPKCGKSQLAAWLAQQLAAHNRIHVDPDENTESDANKPLSMPTQETIRIATKATK